MLDIIIVTTDGERHTITISGQSGLIDIKMEIANKEQHIVNWNKLSLTRFRGKMQHPICPGDTEKTLKELFVKDGDIFLVE